MISKMKIRMFLAIVAMVASCGLMTSCGSDEPEEPGNKVVSYSVSYDAQLGDLWYKYYDVEMSYVNADGQKVTTQLNDNFSQTLSIPADKMPATLNFKVTARIKGNLPEIDESATYSADHLCKCSVSEVYKNGEEASVAIKKNQVTMGIAGANLANFLENRAETTFIDSTIEIK